MDVKQIELGVMPYDDGSGYEIDLKVSFNTFCIVQGNDIIRLELSKWPIVRDAIDQLIEAQRRLSTPATTEGAD